MHSFQTRCSSFAPRSRSIKLMWDLNKLEFLKRFLGGLKLEFGPKRYLGRKKDMCLFKNWVTLATIWQAFYSGFCISNTLQRNWIFLLSKRRKIDFVKKIMKSTRLWKNKSFFFLLSKFLTLFFYLVHNFNCSFTKFP